MRVRLPPLVDYSTAIKSTRAQIIDMESFGFMMALGKEATARAVVLRVITDELHDHGSSTSPIEDGAVVVASPRQRDHLFKGAAEFVNFLRFLDELQADGGAKPEEGRPVDRALFEGSLSTLIVSSVALVGARNDNREFAAGALAANLAPWVLEPRGRISTEGGGLPSGI